MTRECYCGPDPVFDGNADDMLILDRDAGRRRTSTSNSEQPETSKFRRDWPCLPFIHYHSMLGDNLLVAPVFHKDTANFYIPAGKWTCFFTGEIIEGPKYVTKTNYPLDMIPLFVRPNSVLLLGPEDSLIPDYEYSKVKLEVRQYQIEGEVVVDVPVGNGPDWAGKVTVGKDGKVKGEGCQLA